MVTELVEFIFQQRDSVWIAHNGGRFDVIFLLCNLLLEKKLVPETVMNGNKILSLTVNEIKAELVIYF